MLKRNLSVATRTAKSWPSATKSINTLATRPLSGDHYSGQQKHRYSSSFRANPHLIKGMTLFAAAAAGIEIAHAEKRNEQNNISVDTNPSRLESLARGKEKPLFQLKSTHLLDSLRDISGKNLVIMLGRSGVGKSTAIAYGQGFSIQRVPVARDGTERAEVVDSRATIMSSIYRLFFSEPPKIKHPVIGENESTFMPETYENYIQLGRNFVWCDFPGFLDRRLHDEKILTSVVKELAIQVAANIQAVGVTLQESDLDENSAIMLDAFIDELTQWSTDLSIIEPSLFFVITKPRPALLQATDPIGCIMNKVELLLEQTEKMIQVLEQTVSDDPSNIQRKEELEALEKKKLFLNLLKRNKECIVLLNPFDRGESRTAVLAQIQTKEPISSKEFPINSKNFFRVQFNEMLNKIALFGKHYLDLLNNFAEFKRQIEFLENEKQLKEKIVSLEKKKSDLLLNYENLTREENILFFTESQKVYGIVYNWKALGSLFTDSRLITQSYEVVEILKKLFASEISINLMTIILTIAGKPDFATIAATFNSAQTLMVLIVKLVKNDPEILTNPKVAIDRIAKQLFDGMAGNPRDAYDQIRTLVSKISDILQRIEGPIRESKKIKIAINSPIKISDVKIKVTQGEILEPSIKITNNGFSCSADYLPAWYTSIFSPATIEFSVYIDKSKKYENKVLFENNKKELEYITAQIDFLKRVQERLRNPGLDMIQKRKTELETEVSINRIKITNNMERFQFLADLHELAPELAEEKYMEPFMEAYRIYIANKSLTSSQETSSGLYESTPTRRM